jgi:hypothetical protein
MYKNRFFNTNFKFQAESAELKLRDEPKFITDLPKEEKHATIGALPLGKLQR